MSERFLREDEALHRLRHRAIVAVRGWAEDTERGWTGRLSTSNEGTGGYIFERTVRGVKEFAQLDQGLINSADARALDRYAGKLGEVYAQSPVLRRHSNRGHVPGVIRLDESDHESCHHATGRHRAI